MRISNAPGGGLLRSWLHGPRSKTPKQNAKAPHRALSRVQSLSRQLGTPNICRVRLLAIRAPAAASHSSITRSPLGPLCVLLVLNRAHSRPDPSQRRTSIEQHQGASRRATKLPIRSSSRLTFYPTIHTLVDHKISSSTCRFASTSQMTDSATQSARKLPWDLFRDFLS